MRLKIQIGNSVVDIGAKIQEGFKELDRIRHKQAKGLKQFRSRHAPAEERVIAGLNRVTESLGYQLVPTGSKTAATTPVPSRTTRRSAQPKARAKRRS